jgi:putative SOS response-associated peptidase YedK
MIRQDLKSLETEFGATIAADLWDLAREQHKIDPKKFKFAAEDGRIFPNYLAPVIRGVDGKRVIEPIRYSAYPPNYIPKANAEKLTTYNARLDSLDKKFWSESFMVMHGVIIISGFYEWVAVADLVKAGSVSIAQVTEEFATQAAQRKIRLLAAGKKYVPTKTDLLKPMQRKTIIKFTPQDGHDLIVPVIISADASTGLKGFAIVTTDPRPEITSAGHDRMPCHLSRTEIDLWLETKKQSRDNFLQLLARTRDEYFIHQLASAA